MGPGIILLVVLLYFGLLMGLAQLTRGNADNKTFFTGNKNSPWFLVAFGMIGASLSGVTFISVPGVVQTNAFSYMQMVLGYLVGYTIIATILIPLYYTWNVSSIYEILGKKLGPVSHKTGAGFFLLSRIVGASFRLFLVASVLQVFVFDHFGMPFLLTVILTIILIWVYTFQGGIKTIVYTDTLQTAFMLISVVLCVGIIAQTMNLSFSGLFETIRTTDYSTIFFFNDLSENNLHFIKQFGGGALIALVMTGLDQDMMQKNLTCRNTKDAQKNIFTMSLLLIPVNLLFLSLGALLFIYAQQQGIVLPERADHVFPEIALHHFPLFVGIIFLLGLTAAAYSSADSALTSLTTSFCIDFLQLDDSKDALKTRRKVHVAFSVILVITIWGFNQLDNESVILKIFQFATYTYGPLLGLFAYAICIRKKPLEKLVPLVCVASPVMCWVLQTNSASWWEYTFGYELLLVNGGLTFVGLWLSSFLNKQDSYHFPSVLDEFKEK